MNEIIRELASTNPDATPAELSDTIVREIERAIPKAIQRLRLPKPPSPATAKLAQLKLKRMRSLRRSATQKEQSTRERFQAEIYRIRYSLNGHEVSGTSTVTARVWDTSPFRGPDISEYDGQPFVTETALPLEKPDLDARTPPATIRSHPYEAVRREDSWTRVRQFIFHEDFVRRLEDHTTYWRVAKSIEEAARDFAEQTNADWDFELIAETDIEIPTWKRFILSISTPVADLDEKVRQWDLLDTAVRLRIRDLAESYPEHRNDILQFGKSLFLKMELA